MKTELITLGMLALTVSLGACSSQGRMTAQGPTWHNPGLTQAQADIDSGQCREVASTNAQLTDRSAMPSNRDQNMERQRLDYGQCLSSRGYIRQGS